MNSRLDLFLVLDEIFHLAWLFYFIVSKNFFPPLFSATEDFALYFSIPSRDPFLLWDDKDKALYFLLQIIFEKKEIIFPAFSTLRSCITSRNLYLVSQTLQSTLRRKAGANVCNDFNTANIFSSFFNFFL